MVCPGAVRWCLLVLGAAILGGCVQFHPRQRTRQPTAATTPTAAAVTPADAAAAAEQRDRFDRRLHPPQLVWRTIGQSVKGLPLRTTTIGRGPRRVLWIGGIHGDEREGRIATTELPAALAAQPGALDSVTLTILEDGNPDGSVANTRGNANLVDLNRNYPAKNFKPHRMYGIRPLSQPEAQAIHDLIVQLQPHLVIVAHSWRNDRFINFDGPAAALAQRFSRLSSYPQRDSEDIAETPGSLGSWVGRTLGIPILTLEYRRGSEPWGAWRETRVAILAVIMGLGDGRATPQS